MKKNLVLSLLVLVLGMQIAEAKNYTLKTDIDNSGVISQTGRKDPFMKQIPKNQGNGFSDSFCRAFLNGLSDTPDNSSLISTSRRRAGYDPYMIEINGTKYMLIKDNNDGIFDDKDILGIKDTQKNIFASLRPLDTNRDLKLTGEELEKAGIRLVRINKDGKLDYKNKENDFKNSNIEFIYITELRKAYKNDGSTGQFGQYDVIIKNEKGEKTLVTGLVTFETKEQVKKYF